MARNEIADVATVTSKGQTTVPKAVRKALGLSAGDKVAYAIKGNVVTLRKVMPEHRDPALMAFLKLIEKDIVAGRNLRDFPPSLVKAARAALRENPDIDLDEPIEGPVAI